MDFKKRVATSQIIILIKDTCCINYTNYYKKCRRMGELDAGVHYFLDTDGAVHVARQDDAVAGWQYKDNTTSLYILAQSNSGKLNSSQRFVLLSLLESLQKKYKEAQVIERVE